MLQWKDDYDTVPASNITHIDVSNMSFALNLRRSDSAPPLLSPGKDRIALLERARQMREKASKEKSGRKSGTLQSSEVGQLVKDNGCKSSICKQIVLDIFNTHEDTQSLRIQMQDIMENLQEDTNILAQLTKEYEELAEMQQTLLKSLSKLDVDIDVWQRKAQEKKDEQKEIEAQIMAANDMIRKLKGKKNGSSENDATVGNEFHDSDDRQSDARTKPIKQKPSKIHNGHFGLFEGKLQWSCCLAENENAKGCIDNDSVGDMSTLAKIKNSFANQTKVAPLQGSTYRDTSQHHILRYPIMKSLDNLSFDFADEQYPNEPFTLNMPLQSSLKTSTTTHQHQHVAISLPPKASKRPQTSTGVRASSPALDAHRHSGSHFAPFNSFFTSASAASMAMDASPHSFHQMEKKKPQTATMAKSSSTPGFHPHSYNHSLIHGSNSNNNNNLFQVSFADSKMTSQTKSRPKSALGTTTHTRHHHHHHHSHNHSHYHSHVSTTNGHLPTETSRIDSQLPPCTKSVYNNSTFLDTRPKVMPENTLLQSFRDHSVGKVRTVPTSEGKLPRKNRPMSSPAGYALFRDYQAQVHQPELLPELTTNNTNNLSTTSILQLTGYNSNKDKRYASSDQGSAFDRPPRKKY